MTQPSRLAACLLALLMTVPAQADEWSRTGPNGGTVSRTYEPDRGLSVNRTGANGGSTTGHITCGAGRTCQRDFALTGPDGQTVTGQRQSLRGPFKNRSVNTVTRADGTTNTRVPATPRRSNPPTVRRARR